MLIVSTELLFTGLNINIIWFEFQKKKSALSVKIVANHIADEIYTTFSGNDLHRDYFEYITEYSVDITLNEMTVHDILNALKDLDASKHAGPNGCPLVFLKILAMELITPLGYLKHLLK